MDRFKNYVLGGSAAPIAILGVPFDNVSTAETVAAIEQMVASRLPHYLVTANVDFLVQAADDVELRRILFDAHLVLCDGTPLVWASRLLGNPLPERVAGSDLIPILLGAAETRGYRPFFLGAAPEAIEMAVANAQRQWPRLEIAGHYSPPFNRLLEMDHETIAERIHEARPDLLLVGFGCPKQEKWINMHYRSLGVPVSIGVGGTIDFLAGKLARAPKWMQRSGTEWIYRLYQEPRRLAGRYTRDLFRFGGAIAAQCWTMRSRRGGRRRGRNGRPAPAPDHPQMARLPARLDYEEVHARGAELERLIEKGLPLLLNAGEVTFIDSTGVGFLIRLQKRARIRGQPLVLIQVSGPVRHALRLMRLDGFFLTAPDAESAFELLRRNGERPVSWRDQAQGVSALEWSGELTAANAEDFWRDTTERIAQFAPTRSDLRIDLRRLQFIDSTGLGLMIRTKKHGARQGVRIQFQNARADVRNVIALNQLEEYLLKDSPE